MRRFLFLAALGLAPAVWLANAHGLEPARGAEPSAPAVRPKPLPPAPKPPEVDEEPGCHGTSVHFLDTPSEAARQALKEEKLVFVLHVSGHFEDPGIT